jgi:hypothetical protein
MRGRVFMDMQRRQYEKTTIRGVSKRHLQDRQRGISDFQRHTATLADHADGSLSSFGQQYERGITQNSEKQLWDTSWIKAPEQKAGRKGGRVVAISDTFDPSVELLLVTFHKLV